jgi:hypothetical protein
MKSDVIVVRYADDIVLGFEQEQEQEHEHELRRVLIVARGLPPRQMPLISPDEVEFGRKKKNTLI